MNEVRVHKRRGDADALTGRDLLSGEKLRVSETRLEIATAAADIGIWDWDLLTGKFVYSSRARSICGFSERREITLADLQSITHPDDLPLTSVQVERALDPLVRDRSAYEYRIVRSDGSVVWVLAHGEAIFEDHEGGKRAVRYVGTLQDITERRRMEEAARIGAQRLRLSIDAGKMAIWEIDLVADTVAGSPELNRLLHFPEESQPTLEDMRARYYPGERERIAHIAEELLARGERFMEVEYRYILPDGSIQWVLLRCEFELHENRPVRVIGVLADITRQKEIEEALRASESRLMLAKEASGVGVWDWDIPSGHLTWSPEVYAIHGIDADTAEDLYQAWLDVIHPDDRGPSDAAAQAAARDGTAFSIDYRIISSKEVRWVRSQGIVVLDMDERPARVTGINLDVTKQHREQERLQEQTETLESAVEERTRERDRIYELSNDLFAVVGFDGFLKSVNPAWERLLGYAKQQLLARPFLDFVHPDDRASATCFTEAMLKGEIMQRFEDRLIRADKTHAWIAWTAVPEGDLFYAVGRDITAEKEREETIRQGQKMEAVGQLTGGIAHDFNNLLQAVQGNLDLIRRADTSEKVERWASQALQAAERGAKLTAQLLAFSRAQKLELRPVAARELIANMEELLVRTLGPMVQVRLDLDESDGIVVADRTQLEMAVLNLAINGRDAMPDGGELIIRTRPCRLARDPDLPAGDYLKIDVTDAGSGMSPDVAARAFDPFFSTKGIGKGTGLGLSQVYGLARQAGGTARISTRPGEGTTVTLLLRQSNAEAAPAESHSSEAAARPWPSASILVVDDDPDVRQVLVDSLEGLGFDVAEAADGAGALAMLAEHEPDLLLLDFAMPGMNGAQLAEAARSLHPEMPIVFASGYSDTAAIEAVLGATVPLLRKPFTIDELQSAIAAALANDLS